jgi:predicted small lipoprotein YifL
MSVRDRVWTFCMTASRLILLSVLIAAVGVTACGRRAPLERPADVQYEKEREEARRNNLPEPPRPAPTPDRRFVLDPLID